MSHLPQPIKNVFKLLSCWNAERKHQKNIKQLQQMVKEERECHQKLSVFDSMYHN